MNPIVSIIVPVYHVGERLDVCVRSLLGQSYTSIEIILVNDGSTQEDYRRCEKWRETDGRVQVIHKKNDGAASARNAGAENASGEYICFVDADDYVAEHMIEDMMNCMRKTQADVVICDYQDIPDKMQETPGVWANGMGYSGREFLLLGMQSRDLHAEISMIVPWNKLFRRELLADNPFVPGRKHEDLAWHYRVLYQAKKNVYLSDKMYFYVDNQEGTTHSYKKIHEDFLLALCERLSYWQSCREEELYILTYEIYIATLIRMCMEEWGPKQCRKRYLFLKEQMAEYDAVYRTYRRTHQMNRRSRIKRQIFLRFPVVMECFGAVKRYRKKKG